MSETSSSSRVPPQPPSIKLFSPDDQQSPELMRLREFYEAYLKPYLLAEKGARQGTLTIYENALAHWEALTTDPPLIEITKKTLGGFAKALATVKGRKGETLARMTISKHCKTVRAMLSHAGPETGKHPDAACVLDRVPYAKLPKVGRKKPKHITRLDEVGALLDAAPKMVTPEHPYCTAGEWWNAILLADYYTAWRIGTLLRIEWSHLRDGLFIVDENLFKCEEGDEKYVNPELLAALERIRSPRRFIFEWPHCWRHLYRSFDRLMRYAGISETRRKWMKFHGIRKRHGTQAALISPLAAQLSLGHTSAQTGTQHYISPSEITASMIMQLPPPPRKRDDGQRDLFDKNS